MNMNNYWLIDLAAEMCYLPKAAFLRMENEGVINLAPHNKKLYVHREELRRVIEAAEDCPSLLHCTCGGPCNC